MRFRGRRPLRLALPDSPFRLTLRHKNRLISSSYLRDFSIITSCLGRSMDYNFELLKKYGRVVMGRVTSPVVLNILITSVCDMRCVHCFFTEELDDLPRKKNQMTTAQL